MALLYYFYTVATVILYFTCTQCLENEDSQCQDYPGDVKFLYETTEDEDFYNVKYGGPVVYKYRRTIKKGPLYQQNIQQQKIFIPQQQMNAPNKFNLLNNIDNVLTTAVEKNKTEPLPIWKLFMPRNTMHVWFKRVEAGKALDSLELGKDEFENRSMTVQVSGYSKTVDITQYGVVSDAWYVACLDLSISYSAQGPSVCRHCTLLKASVSRLYDQKALTIREMSNYHKANSVRIKYQVDDIPFDRATVITRAYPVIDQPRCSTFNQTNPLASSTDIVLPDTVVYVDLAGLVETYEYRLITTLVMNFDKNKLVANYYFNDDAGLKIPKCSRV